MKQFKGHTSVPEWVDYRVKTPGDLRAVLDEHFDVSNLDARYSAEWETRVVNAVNDKTAITIIDGGCYYWTLRSLAGVENASYLFYDAPDLVDELFERYFTVVTDGICRISKRLKVDAIGFGEDIAYKNGPLISPDMFRSSILPRYRKAVKLGKELGIDFIWYDSDGDLRKFIPNYLSAGIDTFAPCEVAAGMDPVELRRMFGKSIKIIGGFDKRIVATGKDAICKEFTRLTPVIREGGFIPAIDHSVSSDISWDNYRHFIDGLLVFAV